MGGAQTGSFSLGLTRRRFLRAAAGVAGTVAAIAQGCKYESQLFLLGRPPKEAKEPNPAWRDSRVRNYRTLGKTEARMSDVSFGCAGLGGEAAGRLALERGIN